MAQPQQQQGGKQAPAAQQKTPPAATAPRRGRAADDGNDVIRLIEKENPKGGASKDRYALYKDNMTVNAYIKGCEGLGYPASKARADIRWDQKKGFIKIEAAKKSS